MKSRSFFFGGLLLPATFVVFSHSAHALTKANNATALATASSWVENIAPSATDILLFNSTGVPTAGGLTVAAFNGTLGGSLQFTDISGPVTITQSSGNTWTLGPSVNTSGYTGGIDMSAATADVTIGASGRTLRWGSGNYGGISVASGRTLTIGSSFTTAGNTKTIVMTGPGNIIFNGAAGSGGAMGFSITGGANVTMNGAGGWTGGSAKEVINGTLNIGNDSALGSVVLALGGTNSTTPTINASGGARTISNSINLLAVSVAGNATIAGTNALTVNGVLTNSGANRTLSVNNSALTTFGTGGVALSESSTNRVLTINGSGNVTVSGVVANGSTSTASSLTYSGTGLLSFSNANTFGGTLTASSGTTRIDHTLAAQSAIVSVGATNAVTFGAGITTATFGGLSGAGDLALTNTDTTEVALKVGNNNTNSSYSGTLSGAGSLEKIGTGALTVTNTSNSVAFMVTGGTLTGGVTTNSNGGFGSGGITFKGGTISSSMGGNATLSFGNAISVASGDTGTFNTPNRISWSGNVSGAGTLNIGVTTTVSRFDLQNSWAGFTGNANFTGSGGVRLFNNGGTFNTASFQSTALDLGGSVNFQPQTNSGGNTYQIGSLSGSSATASLGGGTAGRATYSVGGLNTSTSFAGAITGNSALTKTGSGTQTLTGTHTYTGMTYIAGGTLALTGTASLASPTIIVGASTTFDVSAVTGGYTLASGQSLSGTGTVTGAMSVAGTLTPGNSPGTLTTGSQTWLDGGDYNWQVLDTTGAAGTGYDNIAITGTLDLSSLTAGQFGINLWSLSSIGPDVSGNAINFNNLLTQSWTILTTTGGITGFDAADFVLSVGANNGAAGFSNALDAGGAFSLGQTGNNLVLTYAVVPEPDAAMLVGCLGMLALLRRRRA